MKLSLENLTEDELEYIRTRGLFRTLIHFFDGYHTNSTGLGPSNLEEERYLKTNGGDCILITYVERVCEGRKRDGFKVLLEDGVRRDDFYEELMTLKSEHPREFAVGFQNLMNSVLVDLKSISDEEYLKARINSWLWSSFDKFLNGVNCASNIYYILTDRRLYNYLPPFLFSPGAEKTASWSASVNRFCKNKENSFVNYRAFSFNVRTLVSFIRYEIDANDANTIKKFASRSAVIKRESVNLLCNVCCTPYFEALLKPNAYRLCGGDYVEAVAFFYCSYIEEESIKGFFQPATMDNFEEDFKYYYDYSLGHYVPKPQEQTEC